MNIFIYGHANISVLTYAINGVYRECPIPGGAAFIHSALESLLNNAGVVPELLPFDEAICNTEEYRREYKTLACYEANEKSYYAISGRLGYRKGESEKNIYSVPPKNLDIPANLIVWDGGFGGLSLPDGFRNVLWASNKVLPDREQFDKVAERCFLFLDADVLRRAGAMISRQISWERTASELIWQLQNNPEISYLLKARQILVAFAEDGAVHIHNSGGELTASLILTHGGAEGVLREKIPGQFDESFEVMTLEVIRMLNRLMTNPDEAKSLRTVLETGEGFMRTGYDVSGNPWDISINIVLSHKDWPAFPIPRDQQDNWTVAGGLADEQLYDVAFNYVMQGAKVIDGYPQLSFGALTTVDRWEIEAYQNIRNLIMVYANGESPRPLSIAVFGSPGSGKSFGVTQIAENVLPSRVKKLEFNVSQFTSLAELGIAFQKVRDTILDGKLPLVFFDEFDSDRDGVPLGWIKSFLMPMQDGKFKDDSGEHPLGRCILVFAGGTASTFENFIRPMNLDPEDEGFKAFKNIKGPDFISRLRGTINVLGPNPQGDADKNYVLRRALLLRSLCRSRLRFGMDERAPINANIVKAMLLISKYKHGARSMEAILDMSPIDGDTWEPVSLPSFSQLSLHVDADAFIALVLQKNSCGE